MSDGDFSQLPPAPPVGAGAPPPPPPPPQQPQYPGAGYQGGAPYQGGVPYQGGAPAGPPPGWGQQPVGTGPYVGPYPASAQPYGQFATPMRRNGLAVAALVLGVLGLPAFFIGLPSLLALILGLSAASRAKASTVSAPGVVRTGGLGQARAGWILGLVGLLAFGAFIAAAATGKLDDEDDDSTVGVFELEVGKCYDIPLDLAGPTTVINDVTEIDCSLPHNAEMFFEGQLNPDRTRPYPSDQDALIDEAGTQCLEPFEAYVGIDYDSSVLAVYPLVSSEVAWNLLRGEFSCFAVNQDASPFTASVRGSRE